MDETELQLIHAIVSAPDWVGYDYDRWARGEVKRMLDRERGPYRYPGLKSERPGGKGTRSLNADNPEASADGAQV